MQFPTVGQILRNNLADRAKTRAESPWDGLARMAIAVGWASTPARRELVFDIASALGAFVQVNTNDQHILGKIISEVGGDMASELKRRMSDAAQSPAPGKTLNLTDTFRTVVDGLTDRLNRYADGVERKQS